MARSGIRASEKSTATAASTCSRSTRVRSFAGSDPRFPRGGTPSAPRRKTKARASSSTSEQASLPGHAALVRYDDAAIDEIEIRFDAEIRLARVAFGLKQVEWID